MTSTPPPTDYALSRLQAAERLGVSIGTVKRLIAEQRLPAVKIGRRVVIRASSIEKLLAEGA